MTENISAGLANVVRAAGVTLLLPAAVAWFYGERSEFNFFLFYAIIIIILGFLLYRKRGIGEVTLTEAFVISSAGWLIVSAIGTIPYLYIAKMHPVDAYFESMSGFTTTGMTVIEDVEVLPRSLLFWRALTQWVGGIGIILFFLLFISPSGLGVWRLYRAEAREEKALATTRETVRYMWKLYLLYTAICILTLIFLAKLDPFDAVAHAFTVLSTGGFSTKNASIGGFGSLEAEIILVFFMLVGATNFIVYIRAITHRSLRMLLKSVEFKACLLIVAGASFLIAGDLSSNGVADGFWDSLRYGAFHATSILTTTGYTLTNIAEFPSLTTWILTILMFIGGGLGSTGGAIKIIRIVILIKAVHYMVSKAALPERAIKPFKIGDHVVGEDETFRVMSFVSAYFLLIIIEGILISFLGGFDPLTAISGALSAQGNVGPCLLPVSKSLSDPVKAVLIFGMWAGRLEIFPVLAILSPYTWKELSRLKALRKMR